MSTRLLYAFNCCFGPDSIVHYSRMIALICRYVSPELTESSTLQCSFHVLAKKKCACMKYVILL